MTRANGRDAADEARTPIRGALRAWMAVEVGFGVAAIASIFLRPAETETAFAWPVRPTVMAAVLGAFYLASALLFALPLVARWWEEVRVMILPTALFAAAMLLATVLHWDRFSVGTAPFTIWLASYVLPPPIFGALYVAHQRGAAPPGGSVSWPAPSAALRFLSVNGALLAATAALVFAWPALVLERGPWVLTPLTTRALAAWLLGLGLLQLSMARERDWRRMRLATTMLLLLPPAITVQLARFPAEVRWGNPVLVVLVADLAASGLVAAWLWWWAARRGAGSAARARRARA